MLEHFSVWLIIVAPYLSSVFNVMFLHSVSRFEEREAELKKEYNTLHQRHTEVRFWFHLKIDKTMYLKFGRSGVLTSCFRESLLVLT